MFKMEILHAKTLDVLETFYHLEESDQYFRDLLDEVFECKGFLSYIDPCDVERKGYNASLRIFKENVEVKLNIKRLYTPV